MKNHKNHISIISSVVLTVSRDKIWNLDKNFVKKNSVRNPILFEIYVFSNYSHQYWLVCLPEKIPFFNTSLIQRLEKELKRGKKSIQLTSTTHKYSLEINVPDYHTTFTFTKLQRDILWWNICEGTVKGDTNDMQG